MYKAMRYMKTRQELRRWFADVADVHLRRSRAPAQLPTAYDDLWRCTQRNWKEQRRTKYKIKKIPTSQKTTIEGLCEGITPENRHAEVDWGRTPVGNEVW